MKALEALEMLNERTERYNNNIKLIVLSDFNKIPDIKDFIQYIYNHKNNFKIITRIFVFPTLLR